MESKITIFLMVIFQGFAHGSEAGWGYGEDNGPSTWGDDYELCNGQSQSPIALQSSQAAVNYDLGVFSRSLFEKLPTSMNIANTGHSIQINLMDGAYEIDDTTLLPAIFKAAQYHIHWAKAGEGGSEHTLNDKQYFGELHIVHYNTKYENISVAADKSDGLAVLGFFIDDTYPQDNLPFGTILDVFNETTPVYEGDSEPTPFYFSIESILPADLDLYYRYKGSLTTPSCYESVLWTVFETPIRISRNQASLLENSIFIEAGDPLNGNFRPTQKLNGRTVEKSPPCVRGTASVIHLSVASLISALVLSFMSQY